MPTPLAKAQLAKVLESPKATATALMAILMDRYGTAFLSWEPDTLRIQVAEDYGAELPKGNWDKIWAAVTLLTTDIFYNSLEAFNHICNALSGNGASFDKWELAEPEEIMWAVAEATLLDPPDEQGYDFSHEIKQFVGLALEEYGIWRTPKLLRHLVERPNTQEDMAGINFSDDPIMHATFFDNQTSILQELEAGVLEQIRLVHDQLSSLPLLNGSPEALQSFQLPGIQQPAAQ